MNQQVIECIRWLLPGNCLLCRQPHARAQPICVACEASLSLNNVTCIRCALPLGDKPDTPRRPARAHLTHPDQLSLQKIDSPGTVAVASTRSGALTPEPLFSCPACSRRPPDFDSTVAPFLMRTGIRALIHLWKFQNRPQLTRLLAELFLHALATHGTRAPEASAAQAPDDEPWLFVPIPTQWQRHIRRGFDHTWLLAQALGALWCGDSTVCAALRNQQSRGAQHRMNRNDRWAKSESRFVAGSTVCNRRVVLIDDVMTTGATARAAATACRRAGAQTVHVWCLARTPDPAAAR